MLSLWFLKLDGGRVRTGLAPGSVPCPRVFVTDQVLVAVLVGSQIWRYSRCADLCTPRTSCVIEGNLNPVVVPTYASIPRPSSPSLAQQLPSCQIEAALTQIGTLVRNAYVSL